MELEEAKRICKDFIEENKSRPIILHTAIDTILKELDNRIPLDRIQEIKKDLDKKYNENVNDVYKNPTIALTDFQRIVGARDLCEKLLNKE